MIAVGKFADFKILSKDVCKVVKRLISLSPYYIMNPVDKLFNYSVISLK